VLDISKILFATPLSPHLIGSPISRKQLQPKVSWLVPLPRKVISILDFGFWIFPADESGGLKLRKKFIFFHELIRGLATNLLLSQKSKPFGRASLLGNEFPARVRSKVKSPVSADIQLLVSVRGRMCKSL
jgi:hypothetical protein